MSKAGDFIKKVEDEIESIFTARHDPPKKESSAEFSIESDNLAIPEIHTGKAEIHEHAAAPANAHENASPSGSGSSGPKGTGEFPAGEKTLSNKDASQNTAAPQGTKAPQKKKQSVLERDRKISIQYDMLAVPEIHIPKE